MITINFNNEFFDKAPFEKLTREHPEATGWQVGPDVAYSMAELMYVEIRVKAGAKMEDIVGEHPGRLFQDSFAGIPLDVQWEQTPGTAKLLGPEGVLVEVVNIAEPRI